MMIGWRYQLRSNRQVHSIGPNSRRSHSTLKMMLNAYPPGTASII